jgi:hypothetical protein
MNKQLYKSTGKKSLFIHENFLYKFGLYKQKKSNISAGLLLPLLEKVANLMR